MDGARADRACGEALTRRHVKGAAAAEVAARLLGRRQTKVCKDYARTACIAEDVLGLQVAVINSEAVTIVNGVDNLEEDVSDEGIVAEIARLFGYLCEEVAIGTIG